MFGLSEQSMRPICDVFTVQIWLNDNKIDCVPLASCCSQFLNYILQFLVFRIKKSLNDFNCLNCIGYSSFKKSVGLLCTAEISCLFKLNRTVIWFLQPFQWHHQRFLTKACPNHSSLTLKDLLEEQFLNVIFLRT